MKLEKSAVKKRVAEGLRKFAIIVGYVWAVLVVLELHKFVIYKQLGQGYRMDYKIGFAFINALILGKVILIGDDLRIGRYFEDKRLVYSILFKSAVFAVLLICFDIVEDLVMGMVHGKTLAQSMPEVLRSGFQGEVLISGLIMFLVLIPFFAYMEIRRVLGKEQLHALIVKERTKADAA